MAHAEICPICHGKGKLPDDSKITAVREFKVTCYGCSGRGWIEVSDSDNAQIRFPFTDTTTPLPH